MDEDELGQNTHILLGCLFFFSYEQNINFEVKENECLDYLHEWHREI